MRLPKAKLLVKLAIPDMIHIGDFDLSNEPYNKAMAKIYIKNKVQDLPQFNKNPDAYELFMGGEWEDGFIVQINKESGYVSYYVKFEKTKYGVCQSTIWKATFDPGSTKLPENIFWFLFEKFGAAISDSLHTIQGKAFWVHRMEEAESKKLKIGLFDGEEISWKESTPIHEWLNEVDAWGSGKIKLRFVIQNRREVA